MINSERGSEGARKLDYFFGVPLLWLLSLGRAQRAPPSEIESLAVLAPAAIGDLILVSASLREFKKKFPKVCLSLFLGPSNQAMIPLLDFVDHIEVLSVKNPLKAFLQIRKCPEFDIVIDTAPWPRISALYSWMFKSKWRIGFSTKGQSRDFLFDHKVPHQNDRHEIENIRALFAGFNLPATNPDFRPAAATIKATKTMVLHLYPGGASPELKQWTSQQALQFINAMIKNQYRIVLTGMKQDFENSENLKNNASQPQQIENICGIKTLPETLAVLQNANLIVSVNTGILHLAAASGTATYGLHGPTSMKRWGALSNSPATIKKSGRQSPRSCSPCLNLGFDYGCKKNDCMKELSVDSVLGDLQAMGFL